MGVNNFGRLWKKWELVNGVEMLYCSCIKVGFLKDGQNNKNRKEQNRKLDYICKLGKLLDRPSQTRPQLRWKNVHGAS